MGFFGSLGRSVFGKNQHSRDNPANAARPYLDRIPAEAGPYLDRKPGYADRFFGDTRVVGNNLFGATRNAGNQFFGEGERHLAEGERRLGENPAALREGYEPYIREGRESGNLAGNEYNRMAANPTAFIDEIMKGYKPSEGYKFKEGRLTSAARNSASSGGYAGTPYDQEEQAKLVQGLLGEDMGDFIRQILGVKTAGLAGQELRAERGYGASGNLAQGMAENNYKRSDFATKRADYANNRANYEATNNTNHANYDATNNQNLANYMGDYATEMATLIQNALSQGGGLAYQGKAQGNQYQADKRNGMLKFISNAIGAVAGKKGGE